MIIFIMQRACQHLDSLCSPIWKELRNFVRDDLVKQEAIRTVMHVKAVAHSEDVAFLLSMLYKPSYLNTFGSVRTVLNLTLYMLLVIDLCGHGGEIARNPTRPNTSVSVGKMWNSTPFDARRTSLSTFELR